MSYGKKTLELDLRDISLVLHSPQMGKVAWDKYSNSFGLFLKDIKLRYWTTWVLKFLIILKVCALGKCFCQVDQILHKRRSCKFKGCLFRVSVCIDQFHHINGNHFIFLHWWTQPGLEVTLTKSIRPQSNGNLH